MRGLSSRILPRIRWQLASDRSGVAAIELALVLPVLLLLLLGTIDIARIVAAKLDLEQAAQRTTDLSLALRPRSSDGAYLRDEAVDATGVAAENVTVDIFLECGGARQASFSAECTAGQPRARFVSIAIRREVHPLFDWAALGAALGYQVLPPSITVSGDSLVRFQ